MAGKGVRGRLELMLDAEHTVRNKGLDEAQAGIKVARRNINNLRRADNTTLIAENKEELESILMKEESEKVGLKLNIQKTKILVSGPITSWQIDGETVTDFIFLCSKITADGGSSHEMCNKGMSKMLLRKNLGIILQFID